MEQDLSGRYMVAAGWGKTSEGYSSDTLQEAQVCLFFSFCSDITFQVEVATDAECKDRMEDFDVSQSLLCAGGDSKGVCFVSFTPAFPKLVWTVQGDSGGSLTIDGTLVGVVSHGYGGDCTQVDCIVNF